MTEPQKNRRVEVGLVRRNTKWEAVRIVNGKMENVATFDKLSDALTSDLALGSEASAIDKGGPMEGLRITLSMDVIPPDPK